MNHNEPKDLCLSLMKADSEEDVIFLLKQAGYWDNEDVWRYFGDNENNFSTIGNQQSKPEPALVEKLVNSVDARLVNECLTQQINPESSQAPQTIQEAVALFFDKTSIKNKPFAGLIREWPDAKRTEVAKGITLSATGSRGTAGNPCYSIADVGEGQTPEDMPSTLLSLNKSNKLRIPFVQGKFNMGGTGVLKFCGKHNLQLIISRRNPAILSHIQTSQRDSDNWSFTIVRREDPEGNRRSSVYSYLAPLGGDKSPRKGRLLRFKAAEMPILPEGQNPYGRMSEYGTLIKLYEYESAGFRSHICMPDGLLYRLDLRLPDVALPIRFYECRDYKGHAGSFETNLTGIKVRLDEDRGKNLEDGYPTSASLRIQGEEILLTIYAFKGRQADTYRKNEGIIFVVNGQTHGHFTKDFYSRKRVGLAYLSNALMVIADCSRLAGRSKEDLFMNSRERLSGGDFRNQLEKEIQELLRNHEGLRALKEERRRAEIESKLDDSKPLENVLEDILKKSPTLSSLFLKGMRISAPFKTKQAQSKDKKYEGNRFPTYFHFKGKNADDRLERECHKNRRCRISFETDVENDFFTRDIEPGSFRLRMYNSEEGVEHNNYTINLHNGIASLTIELPPNNAIGDQLAFIASVEDTFNPMPFTNRFVLTIIKDDEKKNGGGRRRKPPSDDTGDDRDIPSGIQLPNMNPVEEAQWGNHNPPFDKYTALRIVHAGYTADSDEEKDSGVYDYFWNVDNIFLKTEMKSSSIEPDLLKAQYKYALVLIGLAMLQQDIVDRNNGKGKKENEEETNGETIEERVASFTKAVSPIIIPMINNLGALNLDEVIGEIASGEDA